MTVISLDKKISFPGDKVKFSKYMLFKEPSLDEAKKIAKNYTQYEMGFRSLAIPTINGSIICSLKKGFYNSPQEVINLLKRFDLENYETLKNNFSDVFDDLEKQGYTV